MFPRSGKDFAQIVALTAVYATVGIATLSVPEAGLPFFRMVWLPSGIALGWMLLAGPQLWPAVFVGAALVTALTGGAAPHVGGTAVANTLEALLGVWLMNRWCPGARISSRKHLLSFMAVVVLTAGLSSAISVGSLLLPGGLSSGAQPGMWLMWWLTHALGQVVMTPLILAWPTSSHPVPRLPIVESALLTLGLAVTLTISFTPLTPLPLRGAPVAFLIFPFLFWASYRCGQFGAAAASFATALFAMAGTLAGFGPFVLESANASLFLTLLFVSSVVISTLIVAGLVREREHADQAAEALERRLRGAEKLQSLGELAGGIAHDFKNLLVAISGNVDLALMQTDPTDSRHYALQQSAKASARAAELCHQLLEYAAQGPFEHAVWDLESIVGDMSASLGGTVDERTIVDFSMTAEALPVRVDPNGLRQVLINLFSNASESLSGSAGRIEVSTSLANKSEMMGRGLFLLEPPEGTCAVLRVKDSGEGIPAEDLERIFQPVFSTRGAGRGIGLASALGIVLRHGGAMHVESALGEGSTFSVLLPLGEIEDGEMTPPLRPF